MSDTNSQLAVIDVLRLRREGFTVEKACEQVGIAKTTFYRQLQNNPDIVKEVTAMSQGLNLAEFALYRNTQLTLAEKLVELAVKEQNPITLMNIIKFMAERSAQLLEASGERELDTADVYMRELHVKLTTKGTGVQDSTPAPRVIDVTPQGD